MSPFQTYIGFMFSQDCIVLYCIVYIHLYSASCSAHQSEALPDPERREDMPFIHLKIVNVICKQNDVHLFAIPYFSQQKLMGAMCLIMINKTIKPWFSPDRPAPPEGATPR